jgi:drug/metabolite transporter (DMT)-like permease
MWAAMFSWLFLRETLGAAGIGGAGMIVVAALMTQWRATGRREIRRTKFE